MEIREYIQFARRWWWLVLLGAVIAGAAGYLYYGSQEPVYRATATLLVNEGDVVATDNVSGLQASERLAESYVERLQRNDEVLALAISNLGLSLTPQQLKRRMQVRVVGNTQLIELSVESTSPRVAQALANEIPVVFAARNDELQRERFASSKASLENELEGIQEELAAAEERLAELEAEGTVDGTRVEQLQESVIQLRETHSRLLQSYEDIRVAEARSLSNLLVDDAADLPDSPVRPEVARNTLLLVVAGAMAAVGVAFLREYMDNTVKGPDDVEVLVGAPTLGTIKEIKADTPEERLIVARSPRSPTAEAYRQLRTNLLYSLVSRDLQSVLVTSADPTEGKTTTAANLALALVQMGKRVILVDSDLRRPMLHRLFNVGNRSGLSDLVLAMGGDVVERGRFLEETAVDGLWLLPSGPLPPNPAELLGSERMAEAAAWLGEQADYVIYDSAPVLAVTDAAVLSRLADTTLMVVRVGETTGQALQAAWGNLQAVEGELAGVVLTGITRRSGYYYYYNGSGYGYGENGHKPERREERGVRG